MTLTVKVTLHQVHSSSASTITISTTTVKIIADWLDNSVTTGVFGEDPTLPWVNHDDTSTKSSSFTTTIDLVLDTIEKQQAFNSNPFIYAVIMHKQAIDEASAVTVPVNFACIDCSSLSIEKSTAATRSQGRDGEHVYVEVTSDDNMIPSPDYGLLEPLVIDIQKVGGYPVLRGETVKDAIDNVYIYGNFNFGGFQRKIMARPLLKSYDQIVDHGFDMTSSYEDEFQDVSLRTCFLPGIFDKSKVKESFTSSTFTLEVHSEDVYKRAFHDRNIEEYIKLNNQTLAADPAPAAGKAPPKGGKGPPVPVAAGGAAPISDADKFLILSIDKALSSAGKIRPHGASRFRLEQLLGTSNDLLAEFARTRRGIVEGDENVVVKEEMLLEVRMSKPSKPLRWTRPSDISLKKHLNELALEQQSKLDGTLASATQQKQELQMNNDLINTIDTNTNDENKDETMDMTFSSTKQSTTMTRTFYGTSKIPRYEQFPDFETRLVLCCELHRKLTHPKLTPSVLEVYDKGDFQQTQEFQEVMKLLSVTPFTRMVFVFKYDDDDTLLAINRVLTKVNRKALPNIQGSLRSYKFSDEELDDAVKGVLDVVTGFMLIDDETRIVVLEGLAGPGQGMQSVYLDLHHTKPNDNALKILCNPEVLFPDRLYGMYGPDLKVIRIRDKLKKLARRPELYNRKQVEDITFRAIDAAMSLRRATNLRSTKELDMYPSVTNLDKIEVLYGDAISIRDLDGYEAEAYKNSLKKTAKLSKSTTGLDGADSSMIDSKKSLKFSPSIKPESKTSNDDDDEINWQTNSAVMFRRLPTCSRNDDFDQHLQTRPLQRVDYLAEQKEIRAKAWETMLARTAKRDAKGEETLRKVLNTDDLKSAKIYVYSQQKLNFRNLSFAELRTRLSNEKDVTYTYSQDFVSQTISVVDEAMEKQKQKEDSIKHFLTPSGFTYPKPKTRADLIVHPKRPSDARIDDLKDPWQGDAAPADRNENVPLETLQLEKGYSVQVRSGDMFGSLHPVQFSRPFELKLVGDRNKLPRGILTAGDAGDKDPHAFRSIHLGGDDQAKIIEQAAIKEKEDWAKKVVVDSLSVKIGNFHPRDRPLQVDRTSDILKDAPNRNALKFIREYKSSKGRDLRYETTPLTILSKGPFVQNASEKALLRTADKTKFITARDMDLTADGKDPIDFKRFINKNANSNKLISAVSKKVHPPQDKSVDQECFDKTRWQHTSDQKLLLNLSQKRQMKDE